MDDKRQVDYEAICQEIFDILCDMPDFLHEYEGIGEKAEINDAILKMTAILSRIGFRSSK